MSLCAPLWIKRGTASPLAAFQRTSLQQSIIAI
jgi:hypothetical protein